MKMIYDAEKIKNDYEYISIIKDLIDNTEIKKMQLYRQHYKVNCYEHCLHVSYNLFLLCKKFNLDYKSAARAGLLHDLFLYDWRKKDGRKGFHAYTHSKCAYNNAIKITCLNEKEKDMILKHMWPVTLKIPKYKETFLLTYIDKKVAFGERKLNN